MWLSSVGPPAAGVKPSVALGRAGPPAQEFPHLAKESGRFRVRVLRRQLLEFIEQFALALGQLLGCLYHHLHIHVAGLACAQHRHALAVQAESPPGLGSFRNLHAGLASVDGGHFEFAAERGLDHRDRHPAMQVSAVTLEERMRGDRQEDVEISGRATAHASLALAREADACAVLDARRNVDRERALARDAARARAVRARTVDHLAAALAAGAGALEGEEALRMPDAAGAAAVRTGLRLGAGLGAGAGAGLARHRGRDAHLRGLAGKRLFERDLHVVAQIGAALGAIAAAAPAGHAEDALEDVGEGGAETGAKIVCAAAHSLLEGGVAEAVIGGALVGILENLVRLVDFLEALLARCVAGIAIGVPLHRELAESGLEVGVARSALDFEGLVIAALRHPRVPPHRILCGAAAEPYPIVHRASKIEHPRGSPRG